jgi:hypothetical protein
MGRHDSLRGEGARRHVGLGGRKDIDIIGMAKGARYQRLSEQISEVAYLPYSRQPAALYSMTYELRTRGNPLVLGPGNASSEIGLRHRQLKYGSGPASPGENVHELIDVESFDAGRQRARRRRDRGFLMHHR